METEDRAEHSGAVVYVLLDRHGNGRVRGVTTSLPDAEQWQVQDVEYRRVIETRLGDVKPGFDRFGPPQKGAPAPISELDECCVLFNRHGGGFIQGTTCDEAQAQAWSDEDAEYRHVVTMRAGEIAPADEPTETDLHVPAAGIAWDEVTESGVTTRSGLRSRLTAFFARLLGRWPSHPDL